MHVAFNGYFWDQPRTGSGQYLRHLWSALNELSSHSGARDTYTMLLPPSLSERLAPDDSVPVGTHSLTIDSKQLPLLGGRSSDLDKLYWEQWGVAREARRQHAQLLHVPYLTAPAPLPGVKSCPVVVTAHDMIPWVLPAYAGSAPARIYFALAAASVRRADLILADSDASRMDAIKVLKLSPKRVQTVYLGMEPHPQYSAQELADVRARHNLPEHFAFYLGGFDVRKNVPLLLRAWRSVSDWLQNESGEAAWLAIGGAVPTAGPVHPDIMAEAERLGFSGPRSPVRFLGRVSEEDKPLLMAAARLFVYPSEYEGFGLDPLEAMSVGCPVVSSSGGSLQEVIGDAGLLVPPGDEQALIKAITCAWQDAALRASLSSKGRERSKRFTWEHTASRTYGFYSAVVSRRNRKSKF